LPRNLQRPAIFAGAFCSFISISISISISIAVSVFISVPIAIAIAICLLPSWLPFVCFADLIISFASTHRHSDRLSSSFPFIRQWPPPPLLLLLL
jgi:cobalamin biosynthesis protein CobD/CbiB